MNINKWIDKNLNSLNEKVVVITGTTSGLGFSALKHLAKLNANVVCGVRKIELATKQIQEIQNKFPNFKAIAIFVDLLNIESIKKFAIEVSKIHPNGIDAFVSNAGIFAQKKDIHESGYEKHFFVNCLASCFLAKIMIPFLEKKVNSKLVFVSSISFKSASINLTDIDKANIKSSIKTYANAKRFLTFYAYELKKELSEKQSNVCVNICHPGISATSLMSSKNGRFGKFTSAFLSSGMKLLFPNSKQASLNELYALTIQTKHNEWVGPNIFNVYGKPKVKKNKIKLEDNNISHTCYTKINEIIDKF